MISLSLFALLVLLFLVYRFLSRDYDLMTNFDGPPMRPIFGNLNLLFGIDQAGVFQLMRKCCARYGTFRLWALGIGQIHNSRAKEAEILLKSSRHTDKSELYTFLHPFLGTGLLNSNGSKWQHRRKILTPAFHFNILQQFASVFNERSAELVNEIDGRIAEGAPTLDISTVICRFTLNVICETAMGVKLDSMENGDEYRENIYKVVQVIIYRIMRPWLYSYLFTLLGYQRRVDKFSRAIHKFTRSVIKRRRQMFYESQQSEQDLQNENM